MTRRLKYEMFTDNDLRWLAIFFGFCLFVVVTWNSPKKRRLSRSEIIKLIERIIDEKD